MQNAYNVILDCDSYKLSHFRQYPENTQFISSYIEARDEDVDVVIFGLQYQLQKFQDNPITAFQIEEAASYFATHGVPWNREGWEYILAAHNGRMPIAIEAVPEGTVVKGKNVVCQLINTDPQCAWLVSYLETCLLRSIWYPSSVATLSRECKKVIKQGLEATADSIDSLPFKLHDFGARGATSQEAAAIGGAAHLVNFQGTDTVSALVLAREVYGCWMGGFSIPAAEHSTITSWGRENEFMAYQNMIDQFAGSGKLYAVVSDSYDLFNAITNGWGKELKEHVIKAGGTVVIRPDSGDPVEIVRDTVLALMDAFGCEFNSKGFKVLPPYVRVIQGDGINIRSIGKILEELARNRISAENVAFGMGGALLQGVTRDTHKWAMKASAIMIQGVWHDVYKDPITDPGKMSKKGRLALIHETGVWYTMSRDEALEQGKVNHLVPVFKDGKIISKSLMEEIRHRARV